MTNNQVCFLGASILAAGGVVALVIHMVTEDWSELPGPIAIVVALVLGIWAFVRMRREEDSGES